jgi:hypothetical protein
MKLLPALGALSLLTNVALLAVLGVGALTRPPAKSPGPAPAALPVAPAPAPAARDIWVGLKAGDLAAQRDILQAEGFPAAAIRALLGAQLRERFAARRKAIEADMPEQPYWRNSVPDPHTQAQLRALMTEEQKALRELLGPDPINSHAARLRREFPQIAAEKIDLIAGIRERYDELRQDIYGPTRGSLTPSEREKVNQLEQAMQREIAAVLTPDERENYELRTSNTANQLRFTLAEFNTTEAEFRALFRLQSAFDEQHRYVGGGQTPEQQRTRSDAYKKLNEDIAATLGVARYAEYQRATDYNFRQTNTLVSRLNLPPETAMSLYAVQKDVEERRNALYRSGSPAQPATREQLSALASEAAARITTVLGGNKTATELYKQHGGSWLTSLVPRPAPPPAPRK